VYIDTRSAVAPVSPEEMWKSVDSSPIQDGCQVDAREPGQLLRLHSQTRVPGHLWLEMRVTPQPDGGSRYDQRALFYPRGLAGRIHWYSRLPLHRIRLRRLASDVIARAG
jgi:hypothetical protein